jgi:hypothetical protein
MFGDNVLPLMKSQGTHPFPKGQVPAMRIVTYCTWIGNAVLCVPAARERFEHDFATERYLVIKLGWLRLALVL